MSGDEVTHRSTLRLSATGTNDLSRGTTEGESSNDSTAKAGAVGGRRAGGRAPRLRALAARLSEEDWAVLDTLALVRMASGRQLGLLHFEHSPVGTRRAQRHLQHLCEQRILTRLPRVVGGVRGGSKGHIYSLDVNGQRLAQTTTARAVRKPTPSDAFVDHTIGVTELYVALRTTPAVELLNYQPEPACWRSFTSAGSKTFTLRPDAFARWAIDEWELSAFFEVDRATEHPARLERACHSYVRYWRTGSEQRDHEVFPQVVWVTPHDKRAAVIEAVVARLDTEHQHLFRVITNEGLAAFISNQGEEVEP